jgi:hypothetical protein
MNPAKIDLFYAAIAADELDIVKLMIKKYNIVDFNFMMDYYRENLWVNSCIRHIADIIDNFYTFLLCLDKTIALSKDIVKIIYSYFPPRKYYQKLYLSRGSALLDFPLLNKFFGAKNIRNIVIKQNGSQYNYLSMLLSSIRRNDICTLAKIIKYFPLNKTYYYSVNLKMTHDGPCFRMYNPLRYAIREKCNDTTIKFLLKHGATLFTDEPEK